MIRAELSKIWHPFLMLMVIILCIFQYIGNLSLDFKFNDPTGYYYAEKWQDQFGKKVSEVDLKLAKAELGTINNELEILLQDNDIAKKYHIKNYQDYKAWTDAPFSSADYDKLTQAEQAERNEQFSLYQNLRDSRGNPLLWVLEDTPKIIPKYEQFLNKEAFFAASPYTKKEEVILRDRLYKDQAWQTLLPPELALHTTWYLGELLNLGMVIILLLVPVIFVRDRVRKLRPLQWSSKKGRAIVWSQYWATLTASLSIWTLLVVVCGSLYLGQGFHRYFGQGLNSFLAADFFSIYTQFSLFSWTFGQWLLVMLIISYLLITAFASLVFLIGQTSQTYLGLILKGVILLTVSFALTNKIVTGAFHLQNLLYHHTHISYIELYLTLLLVGISVSSALFYCRQTQKKMLVND